MVDEERPTLVVGVHDEETGRLAVAHALDLAARLGGELVLAHVEEIPWDAGAALPASGMAGPPVTPAPVGATPSERERDDRWLRDLCAEVARELNAEDVPCSYRRAVGDPGGALADLAEETAAYLVVVGSRGEGFWAALGRLFRPSVSRSVLRGHVTPVLVVPSTLAGSPD